MCNLPELYASISGQEVVLVMISDVGNAFRRSSDRRVEDETFVLDRAANFVRKQTVERNCIFDGSFD